MEDFFAGCSFGGFFAWGLIALFGGFTTPEKMIEVVQQVEQRCSMAGGTQYIKGVGPRYGCKDGSTGKLPDTEHPTGAK